MKNELKWNLDGMEYGVERIDTLRDWNGMDVIK